jgi:hypothetical protein
MKEHEDQHCDTMTPLYKARDKEHTAKVIWRGLALFLLSAILWQAFHTVEWRPNFDVNNVLCFRRSWWGFKQQTVVCEWRKDADPDQVPAYGWCTKYSDGKWHIFYAEEGDELVLNWPTQNRAAMIFAQANFVNVHGRPPKKRENLVNGFVIEVGFRFFSKRSFHLRSAGRRRKAFSLTTDLLRLPLSQTLQERTPFQSGNLSM